MEKIVENVEIVNVKWVSLENMIWYFVENVSVNMLTLSDSPKPDEKIIINLSNYYLKFDYILFIIIFYVDFRYNINQKFIDQNFNNKLKS